MKNNENLIEQTGILSTLLEQEYYLSYLGNTPKVYQFFNDLQSFSCLLYFGCRRLGITTTSHLSLVWDHFFLNYSYFLVSSLHHLSSSYPVGLQTQKLYFGDSKN